MMVMDVYYCDDHFTLYTNIESLRCTPETNTMLYVNYISILKTVFGTSLVAQWLRIRLPMQGTQVRALVREDPTCRGATKPVHHNY